MDAVKVFDIEIDINDCSKLYDYGRGEYVTRPGTGWDRKAISDACRQAVAANEEADAMIKRMDKIVTFDKGFFEKDKKKDQEEEEEEEEEGLTVDNFSDDAMTGLPMRVLPVFNPGDVISGQLVLEAVDTIEAQEVTIAFKGGALTNIRHYIYTGMVMIVTNDQGKVECVNETVAVWRKTGSEDVDEKALMNSDVQVGDKITPGKYTFPFSFKLPVESLQSVPPLVKRICGNWASAGYYIKATIGKGKTLRRGNIITNRGLYVEKPYNIANIPKDLTPVIQEQVQETGVVAKGKVTCRATLPARAYVRGTKNHIPLQLEINNQSDNSIKSIKACVVLNSHYRARTNKWHGTRSTKFRGARAVEEGLGEGQAGKFSMYVPMDFTEDGMDGNIIPAGTLDDCDIIDVWYEVNVLLKRSGLSRNMEFSIPIKIGTENSKDAASPKYA